MTQTLGHLTDGCWEGPHLGQTEGAAAPVGAGTGRTEEVWYTGGETLVNLAIPWINLLHQGCKDGVVTTCRRVILGLAIVMVLVILAVVLYITNTNNNNNNKMK